jgi:glycosyltransferase involved in cell wall biosynthesis
MTSGQLYSKISVLIPTRGRVERLKTLLSSFEATTSSSVELLFRVDTDDDATIQFLEDRRKVCDYLEFIVGPRLNGYASLSVFFNELRLEATGDVLMLGNDDLVFRTPGWAQQVLEVANQHPDGLFNIGVKTHNETHFPLPIVSAKAIATIGFFWDPRLVWGDIFLRDVMESFGRAIPLPSVQIDHDWAGNAPDQTFIEGNAQRFQSIDNSYWQGTHLTAVTEAAAKLRVLQHTPKAKASK